MLSLPNELLDHLVSLLDICDLWSLAQVSRRLRDLAIFPLLARHNVSAQDIQSGALTIYREDSFILLVPSHLNAVRKLEILPGGIITPVPDRLSSILSMIPPISDIHLPFTYYDRPFKNRSYRWLGLCVCISSSHATDPVEANAPPEDGNLIRRDGPAFDISLAFLICGLVNVGPVIARGYRQAMRIAWDSADRIQADLGPIHGPWMRIQSLLESTPEEFTLVTFGSNISMRFTIPHLPSLMDAHRSAFLAAAYIPHLLPSEPSVRHLEISSPGPSPISDALPVALNVIALLPGTHPLSLVIHFNDRSVFPWDANTVSNQHPLHRVTKLTLLTGSVALEVALFARCLAAPFPQLAQVCLYEAPTEIRVELEGVIQAARPANAASLKVIFERAY
ncbi:hypothetical protein B0H17DRAFT_1206051 [Mycena rosella]|uniref:F-box domain-containing protein n=1 Tax=Mycena rosella TaxID=1033263 RepID=A0AAD7D5T0_MYCRO|nr:hypothetical protein B0H17DRAFT_1206051 [Mycena rosella]